MIRAREERGGRKETSVKKRRQKIQHRNFMNKDNKRQHTIKHFNAELSCTALTAVTL
jgi:hypothetical protein